MYTERFEQAFQARIPRDSLCAYAVELSANGLKRSAILALFVDFHRMLQEQEREADEAILGDVMDMIANTFKPFNLNLPE
jgi:hypothetical protein